METKMADGAMAKRKEEKMEIKRKAIRFTKIVSLVGIRHATDERNSTARRCVWILWLIFGFAFAFYQIGDQVNDYFMYKSRIENRIQVPDRLPFPQVTICNENPIMPGKAKEHNITGYMQAIEMKLSQLRNDSYDQDETVNELRNIVNEFHEVTKDWETLSRTLAQPLNETIFKVSFNDSLIDEHIYAEEIITDLGYCYAFGTKNKPLHTTKEGALNGLIVVLNANRQAFAFNSSSKPGYKILIHDPYETPLLKESGFSLELGMITRVAISLRNVTLQGHPYDKCDKNESQSYWTYRTVQCHAARDFSEFRQRCNCIDLYMRDIVAANGTTNGTNDETLNGTICSLAQIINCTDIADGLSRIANASSSTSRAKSKECLPQCHSPTYSTSITRSSFPLLMNEVSKIPGEAQVQNRFRVQIYYPHLSYIQADSFPAKSLVELICDISGALSLLLGATLLTVYEAAEFLFLFFKDYLQFCFRK